jgi:hypothetical protein
MAEGSKAADLSSVLFGGVGSNPTPSKKCFDIFFLFTISNANENVKHII